LLPGSEIVINPPHVHIVVQPVCNAGWPSIITLVAPGVHGDVVSGTHGAGVKAPSLAAVAAATTGFDIVPHIPKVGMLTIGANASVVAAKVPHVTGVPVGTTASGTGIGGIAIEQEIIAPVLTSGGTGHDCTPAASSLQARASRGRDPRCAGARRP
jgi:hypothetical protein